MLSRSHYQIYKKLEDTLSPLQELSEVANVDLYTTLQKIHLIYQQEISPLNLEDLEDTITPRLSSIHTETCRALRLLSTEVAFWKMAQQPDTKKQKLVIVQERIKQILTYCGMMVNL